MGVVVVDALGDVVVVAEVAVATATGAADTGSAIDDV
jgi:hypothetical protein